MQSEDRAQFKEAMDKEIESFKKEEIFKLLLLKDKSSNKLLIPFV